MSLIEENKQTFLSIIMAITGFLLFSMADVCAKYLGVQGYHTHIIQLYTSAVACLIGVAYVLIQKKSFVGFKPVKSVKLHTSKY